MARRGGRKREENKGEPEPGSWVIVRRGQVPPESGLTSEQWEALQERVRKRREQQEPFRKQMFEEYVRALVRLAKEMYWERTEKYEREQQLDEQRQRERELGQPDG